MRQARLRARRPAAAHVPPVHPVPLPVALPGRTRVWTASVAENAAAATARRGELDRAESLRAGRFRRFADLDRFLVAHICLRDVLGTVLETPPGRLVIDREPCTACGGPHGRPYLPGRPVHFSLAHAGDLVLVAVAPVPVGVDVEEIPSDALVRDTAAALHEDERAELLALSRTSRPAAFARCWTRKEAVLKSTGQGLAHGARLPYVGTAAEPPRPPEHQVYDLPTPAGTAGALALWTG
ncbi:4'-phosphopantetheinyl transferase family protein [Streptomyces sp. NPDC058525]|uniref:4'-phosphopantetheinyl transferase family protein n=1 Tax=Streptomyces sp. NPDC058525 TaxID=3346538 RepID=UPI0036558D62